MKWRHRERRASTGKLIQTTPSILPDQTEQQAMVPIQIETVGGQGDTPVEFYVGEGAVLPPGMVLSSDGVLSGTPTLAGTYRFTIEAIDGA